MPERTSSSELDAGTVEGRAELRRLAAAAREPSRQRLELFMATGPEVVLHLLDHYREEEE
jgi:hypothetical protein